MIERLFSIKSLKLAALCFLGIWLFSLPFHPINIDDAWNGELAYWGSKGPIRYKSFESHADLDRQVFFYHKGLILNGIAVVKTFGFNAFPIKAISVFYTLLLLGSLWFWKNRTGWKQESLYLTTILLVSSQVLFEFGNSFRAETAVAFFIFNSTVLLTYLNTRRSAAIAGALVGLAVFFHVNSLIFGVSSLALILYKKEYRRVLPFCICSALFCLLYFYDMHTLDALQTYLKQFTGNAGVIGRNQIGMLERLATEHLRYFHTAREATISFIYIWVISKFKKINREEKSILVFLLVSSFFLAVIAHGKTSRYLIYFLPFIYLLFSEITFRQQKKSVAFFLALLLLLANWTGNIELLVTKYNKLTEQEMSLLAQDIPPQSKVVGPFEFFFVAAGRFDFTTLNYISLMEETQGKEKTLSEFLHQASLIKAQYAVSNKQWNHETKLNERTPVRCVRDWCLYDLQ